jgi:hypothetical protein
MVQSYPDDDEMFTSTRMPLPGVAVQYKSALDSLLSFVHDSSYERTKTYKKGELRILTPDDVVRWMNVKAFGVPDPPSDANPTFAQSNLLVAYWRKAISFSSQIGWLFGFRVKTREIQLGALKPTAL